MYAIGPKAAKPLTGWAADEAAVEGRRRAGISAGHADRARAEAGTDREAARAAVRRQGTLPARRQQAELVAGWAEGTVTDGTFIVAPRPEEQAGLIKATVGAVTREARARVAHPLPWTETFEAYADGAVPPGWMNAVAGKFSVTTLDGQKVLQKAPDDTIFQRLRMFIGPVDWSNYTFEADVRVATRRRQMGDIGITAQRYSLVLYGNSQQLKLEPWEPETQRTVTVPFAWKPDAWYHLKLRVENLPTARSARRARRGRPANAEPAAWMIDKVDPIGNRQGAPGFFATRSSAPIWTTSRSWRINSGNDFLCRT